MHRLIHNYCGQHEKCLIGHGVYLVTYTSEIATPRKIRLIHELIFFLWNESKEYQNLILIPLAI